MAFDFLKRYVGAKLLGADESPNTAPSAPTKVVAKGSSIAQPSSQAPQVPAVRNPAKDRLFGNLPLNQWPPAGSDVMDSPWSEFVAARNHLMAEQMDQAIAIWQTIIATPNLEALHYLQAWRFLRQHGVQPPEEDAKNVYGVISEQGKSGVLVAVYLDGQARLYSDQGQGIVWAHPDASLDPMIEAVLGASTMLMLKVKQSDPKIDSPRISINSISVLTPSGIYTKTGAPGTFETLPLIKPVAEAFTLVTKALVEKAGQSPQG